MACGVLPLRVCTSAGALALALSALGCATTRSLGDGFVVDSNRLVDELAGRSATVVDIRPLQDYKFGHLAGARWIDAADWKRFSLAAGHGLTDTDGWSKRLADAGLRRTDAVLIYDGGEMTEAARIWFILQSLGFSNAAVVNGGYPAISGDVPKERLATGPPRAAAAPRGGLAVGRGARVKTADKQRVKSAIDDKSALVVDVRSKKEFAGSDARGNRRVGHLPTAVNLPHTELLDGRGHIRSAADLRKLFEQAGASPGRPVIVHCQSGGRSALAALAAARAGFGNIENYYNSFGEWAADETCPVVAP